ncbi:hypothetical protein KSF_078070 [Reticulibacter mediterranei]|uniref:Uncharacterized protein n=1 Tax=Reticulibacter mediterranei TaxID=2778369 RepID=A0A8J3ITU7_9CHLR|nr:hypothetical protein [Reticulibacter mediterranei]GHO97759.1 hypothetical protein KSF_078070 [Reticulibacter mediterranei]
MRRSLNYHLAGVYLLLTLAISACSLTQSPFVRMVDGAGGTFSAAATTLAYFHQGKLTRAYTISSFAGYESQLDGLDQQLPAQQGADDQATVKRLLALYKPAMQVVQQPCLESSCDWRGQVTTLERAGKAFVEVGEA